MNKITEAVLYMLEESDIDAWDLSEDFGEDTRAALTAAKEEIRNRAPEGIFEEVWNSQEIQDFFQNKLGGILDSIDYLAGQPDDEEGDQADDFEDSEDQEDWDE